MLHACLAVSMLDIECTYIPTTKSSFLIFFGLL